MITECSSHVCKYIGSTNRRSTTDRVQCRNARRPSRQSMTEYGDKEKDFEVVFFRTVRDNHDCRADYNIVLYYTYSDENRMFRVHAVDADRALVRTKPQPR